MEKMLWLIKRVKSDLPSFVLDISCWALFHGRVDQLRLIANNLIEDAQRYTTRQITDTLETLKSSAENQLHQLVRVNRFDVYMPSSYLESEHFGWTHIKQNITHSSEEDERNGGKVRIPLKSWNSSVRR